MILISGSTLGAVLTEHWDGTAWKVVASPAVPNSIFATLNDVSCHAAGSCIAVGFKLRSGTLVDQALAEELESR